jgi:hypothetical protein
MGVAIMGSLINSTLASELVANMPPQVRENAPPTLLDQLRNPQILLSPEQLGAVRGAFEQLPQGGQLFESSILAIRTSLAVAITDAFVVAVFVTLAAVGVGAFLKEVPLRRGHDLESEAVAAAGPAQPSAATSAQALPPVAGGSNGPGSGRPLAFAAVGTGLAFARGLLAFVFRRNGG